MAERDRRAGRVEVAAAALGEASEWPARVVLALCRMPQFEAPEARLILEEGLDRWVVEVGLAPFGDVIESPSSDLDRPIDNDELELAFAEAEAQTDEMLSANHVAERILMDEPLGLTELDGDSLPLAEDSEDAIGIDAAFVADSEDATAMDAAFVEEAAAEAEDPAVTDSRPSRTQVLAILEHWLQNLEGSGARRAG